MKATYFVWKDPSCNGVNPDWREITGSDFYNLVRSLEGKGRFFVKIGAVNEDEGDASIVMESTKTEYVKWRKEKDHSDYLREQQRLSGYQVVSYNAMDTEYLSGEELLEDASIDIQADYIKSVERKTLKQALSLLTEDEYRLVDYFYLSGSKGTVRQYSAMTGIPVMTVQNRKTAVLKKLRNFLEN